MEIEKKYLLFEDDQVFEPGVLYDEEHDFTVEEIIQGYLDISLAKAFAKNELGVDILFPIADARLREQKNQTFDREGTSRLTLVFKSDGTLKRHKVEIPIERQQFDELWPHTEGARIEKLREIGQCNGYIVKVNNYQDRALLVAEVEFTSEEEAEAFPVIGKDVTEDPKYKNRNLAQ